MRAAHDWNKEGQLAADFNRYNTDKASLITRCEEYAGWTLPGEFPMIHQNTNATEVQHDYQSVGAKAVNHLSNKIVFTMFAPTRPFFRLDVSREYMMELEQKYKMAPADVQMALSRIEQEATKSFAHKGLRVALNRVMTQLIITGNALLFFPPTGGKAQVYTVRDYCCKRDLSGEPLDIITQERKALQTLPADIQAQLKASKSGSNYNDPDTNVFLYTRARLHDGKYHVYQAVDNVPLTTKGVYPAKDLPWVPLTWKLNRGFDYGTGLVEDYAGDFHALSVLSESMVIGASIAAEIKFLVDPAGATDVQALNEARNGDYVSGREADISVHQTDKTADWNFVVSMMNGYEKRLGQAFLLGSAVTRDAERVTAEEIRFQANELETSLGGVYSRLSEDLQLPLAYMAMSTQSVLVGEQRITPVIITGMESLSRNSDVDNMMLYLQDLSLVGQLPEIVQEYIQVPAIMALFGAARSVDYTTFMKSDEEVQQARQERAQQEVATANAMEAGKANAQPVE